MRSLLALALAATLLAATLLAVATPASAQGARQVGNWRFIDGIGCTVVVHSSASVADDPEGTSLVIAFLGAKGVVLILASESWDFAAGQRYDVSLRFDGGTPLIFSLAAGKDPPRLVLEGAYWPTLFERLAAAQTLEVRSRGRTLASFGLEGGAQAIAAIRACEARYKNPDRATPAPPPQSSSQRSPPSAAPSRPPISRKSDPFAD